MQERRRQVCVQTLWSDITLPLHVLRFHHNRIINTANLCLVLFFKVQKYVVSARTHTITNKLHNTHLIVEAGESPGKSVCLFGVACLSFCCFLSVPSPHSADLQSYYFQDSPSSGINLTIMGWGSGERLVGWSTGNGDGEVRGEEKDQWILNSLAGPTEEHVVQDEWHLCLQMHISQMWTLQMWLYAGPEVTQMREEQRCLILELLTGNPQWSHRRRCEGGRGWICCMSTPPCTVVETKIRAAILIFLFFSVNVSPGALPWQISHSVIHFHSQPKLDPSFLRLFIDSIDYF